MSLKTLSAIDTSTPTPAPDKKPKSYLSDDVRQKMKSNGASDNSIFLEEARAATLAGDSSASWNWLARSVLPAHTLRWIKERHGAQFIRAMGFDATEAEEAYGKDWLDRE